MALTRTLKWILALGKIMNYLTFKKTLNWDRLEETLPE
jgi:hypothetical protein